jgi:N-methylhydantoinase A
MKLDLDGARGAIEEKIAKPMGMSLTDAAWGIHNIVNENMALAAKIHIAEKGGDPMRTTLIAFGGAGPVHAYELARKLKMPQVTIPLRAGVASAVGFFSAPFNYELVHTYRASLDEVNMEEIENVFQKLRKDAIPFLPKMDSPEQITFDLSIDMHYVGQGYEISVPLPKRNLSQLTKGEVAEAFASIYEAIYGRRCPDKMELMNLRLIATAPRRSFSFQKFEKKKEIASKSAVKGQRKAYNDSTRSYVDYTVYDRYELTPGANLSGPAIIEERESTIVVGGGATASVDEYKSIVIFLAQET